MRVPLTTFQSCKTLAPASGATFARSPNVHHRRRNCCAVATSCCSHAPFCDLALTVHISAFFGLILWVSAQAWLVLL
ncbi:hypothetical protein BV25DRAFT_1180511 [Artomyces pyxidatus]|uniref:Uncharacterized protein n=1 Tax=Artomyces pyxidatus TaxID=48021 RepID=A0ACB8SSC6_9AGAM|nr:hypothetical protein BV25DRAFT_1180511 [Artomyces pyxidatus]